MRAWPPSLPAMTAVSRIGCSPAQTGAQQLRRHPRAGSRRACATAVRADHLLSPTSTMRGVPAPRRGSASFHHASSIRAQPPMANISTFSRTPAAQLGAPARCNGRRAGASGRPRDPGQFRVGSPRRGVRRSNRHGRKVKCTDGPRPRCALPRAVATEGRTDRTDEAQLAAAVVEGVALGHLTTVIAVQGGGRRVDARDQSPRWAPRCRAASD